MVKQHLSAIKTACIPADALSQKVDELKRGRGAVLECNHMVIIGWSEKVLSLIDQLCQGFEMSRGTTVRDYFIYLFLFFPCSAKHSLLGVVKITCLLMSL